MDSKIFLGKILQRFQDRGYAHVSGYKKFGFVSEAGTSVTVLRENGNEAKVPFAKIITGIEAYQSNPELYDEGPSALREFGITHITSPVFALLHLLPKNEYQSHF